MVHAIAEDSSVESSFLSGVYGQVAFRVPYLVVDRGYVLRKSSRTSRTFLYDLYVS